MTKKTRNFVVVSGAILTIGLGTGLVASYMGLPVSLLSSAAGPDELQYIPQNAAVVAYANVRDVMNSEFRQRFRQLEPRSSERASTFPRADFEARFDPGPAAGNKGRDRERGKHAGNHRPQGRHDPGLQREG